MNGHFDNPRPLVHFLDNTVESIQVDLNSQPFDISAIPRGSPDHTIVTGDHAHLCEIGTVLDSVHHLLQDHGI
jgi:hypothetical protein